MLRFKLFKWFALIILIFGALSAYFGIRMIGERVVEEAQTRVRSNLSSAWAVYQSHLQYMETVVKLTAIRPPVGDICQEQRWQDAARTEEMKGLLGRVRLEFNLDFIAIVTPEAQVIVRSSPPFKSGDFRSGEPILAKALSGQSASGTALLSREELFCEADGLCQRAHMVLHPTPHTRPTPRTEEDRGMVMLAAAPIERNGRVVGAIYAGTLLNRNHAIVDRIQDIVFGPETYHGAPLGTTTIFLDDTRVTTTVRMDNGNRALGTRVSTEVADRVLDNNTAWIGRAFVVRDWYLTAYDPIRNARGEVVGMLYVGILERPFADLSRTMILRYSSLVAVALAAALVLAFFMAERVTRPLHRLAEASKRMERGESTEPVSAGPSCQEATDLIHAFNQMAGTLGERERDLKGANEQLAQANSSLTALNKDYMETVEFVSHELKSPISSILNYTYLLRQRLLGEISEKQEKALAVMDANLRRLTEMIRHYLNLARIESGEICPVLARVALREDVVDPLLHSLETDIKAKRQHVENHIAPQTLAHSDLNMTREVFENLLSNAVKYGREGGAITLECRADGDLLRCSVRNEGEGIPPEKTGELFRKFSRVGGEPDKHKGTGLGLFISRKIIEAHGGRISVDSKAGEWTEFRFTFPRHTDASGTPRGSDTPKA